jgi:hypothetical protein
MAVVNTKQSRYDIPMISSALQRCTLPIVSMEISLSRIYDVLLTYNFDIIACV